MSIASSIGSNMLLLVVPSSPGQHTTAPCACAGRQASKQAGRQAECISRVRMRTMGGTALLPTLRAGRATPLDTLRIGVARRPVAPAPLIRDQVVCAKRYKPCIYTAMVTMSTCTCRINSDGDVEGGGCDGCGPRRGTQGEGRGPPRHSALKRVPARLYSAQISGIASSGDLSW